MANPEGSKNLYLNRTNAEALEGWSAEELAILISKGRKLFELTMSNPTPEELEYLTENPELMEVVEKW
jgi:hypothetical protein